MGLLARELYGVGDSTYPFSKKQQGENQQISSKIDEQSKNILQGEGG